MENDHFDGIHLRLGHHITRQLLIRSRPVRIGGLPVLVKSTLTVSDTKVTKQNKKRYRQSTTRIRGLVTRRGSTVTMIVF